MVEFLGGLGVSIYNVMKVNVDNQGAIALAKNPVFHDRLKHPSTYNITLPDA